MKTIVKSNPMASTIVGALCALKAFANELKEAQRRRQSARQLADVLRSLDDRTLQDIGIEPLEMRELAIFKALARSDRLALQALTGPRVEATIVRMPVSDLRSSEGQARTLSRARSGARRR